MDASAFATDAGCAAAVSDVDAIIPVEVVAGGFAYEGTPTASVIVARMASPSAATGWIDAVADASLACDGVPGQAVEPGGLTAIRTLIDGAPAVRDAGMTGAGFGYDGELHVTTYVIASHHELVMTVLDEPAIAGWDTPIVSYIQSQFAVFDAAVA